MSSISVSISRRPSAIYLREPSTLRQVLYRGLLWPQPGPVDDADALGAVSIKKGIIYLTAQTACLTRQ